MLPIWDEEYIYFRCMIDVSQYLHRIRYTGNQSISLQNLFDLHRCHLLTVPYENIDIQLGDHGDLSEARLAAKIIHAGRGGQCLELNTLFALLLEELGYTVHRVAAHTEMNGHHSGTWAPHMALLVEIQGKSWICDVGFGDAFLEPLPLADGTYSRGGFYFGVEQGPQAWWIGLHGLGDDAGFWLWPEPQPIGFFSYANLWSSSSPESFNVQTLNVFKMETDHIRTLRSLTTTIITPTGKTKSTVSTEAAFREELESFGVDTANIDIPRLWSLASYQHAEWISKKEKVLPDSDLDGAI